MSTHVTSHTAYSHTGRVFLTNWYLRSKSASMVSRFPYN